LNENSSQHTFKKLKRKFGEENEMIKEYCYKILKL
jgi:hypothetical protein